MAFKHLLLAGAAVCCPLTSAANAQNVKSESQEPAPAASTADGASLEEIVVTAQKRAENLQKVPIAVTAVTAGYAANIGLKSSVDIQMAAPAVNWGSTVGGANISIRGITGTGSAGDESANAVYVDGVYNPVGGSLLFGFNNIERIEVLKGPQGTLFGRNASGGAIQIITRDPSHDVKLDASLGYGNFQTTEGSAYLTGGLTSNLAADASVYFMDMGKGWGINKFNGHDAYRGRTFAFRTKWLWDLDDATKVTGIYSHSKNRPATGGGASILPGEGVPYVGFFNVNNNLDMYNQTNQDNGSLKVDHDLGWANVVNIASVDLTEQFTHLDTDSRPVKIGDVGVGNSFTDSKSFTEELQLVSAPSSAVKWVVGAFYYWNRQRRNPFVFQGAAFPGGERVVYGTIRTNSYALFGQTTVPITDTLKLTGGLRYTKDIRDVTGRKLEGGVPVNYIVVATGQSVPEVYQRNSSGKLTWRGAIDYQVTSNVLLYGSASRGFKSGFFNMTQPNTPVALPQTVDAYEIGIKTELFDRRLRLNVSAYTNDFQNIQLRKTTAAGPYFLNAASAKIKGIDVDMEARPTPELTLQGGLTYLDGHYGKFLDGPTFSIGSDGVFREGKGDLSGRTTVRTPTLTVSFGGTYAIMSKAGKFAFSMNAYYNDGFYFDPENRVPQPKYTILNGSIGWTSPNQRYDLRVWGKNMLDEHYYTDMAPQDKIGDQYFAAAPATYGVTVGVHF